MFSQHAISGHYRLLHRPRIQVFEGAVKQSRAPIDYRTQQRNALDETQFEIGPLLNDKGADHQR